MTTFERGAVKAMQNQFTSVQMSRQCLEEGGGPCDWNITGTVNQHLKTYEVKDHYNIILLKHQITW